MWGINQNPNQIKKIITSSKPNLEKKHQQQKTKKQNKTKTNIHLPIYTWLFFPDVFYMFDHPGHQVTCERNNAEKKKNNTKKKHVHVYWICLLCCFCFVFVVFFKIVVCFFALVFVFLQTVVCFLRVSFRCLYLFESLEVG